MGPGPPEHRTNRTRPPKLYRNQRFVLKSDDFLGGFWGISWGCGFGTPGFLTPDFDGRTRARGQRWRATTCGGFRGSRDTGPGTGCKKARSLATPGTCDSDDWSFQNDWIALTRSSNISSIVLKYRPCVTFKVSRESAYSTTTSRFAILSRN